MFKFILLFAVLQILQANKFDISYNENTHPIFSARTNMDLTRKLISYEFKKCPSKHYSFTPMCLSRANQGYIIDYQDGLCQTNVICSEGSVSSNCKGCQSYPKIFDFVLSTDFNCQEISVVKHLSLLEGINIDACKIGNIKLRECVDPEPTSELVNWVTLENKIYFPSDLSLVGSQHPELIGSYKCNGSCPCTGDHMYCSNFDCSQKVDGYCRLKKRSEIQNIKVGETLVPIECWGSSMTIVEREKSSSETEAKPLICPNCEVKCKSGIISVETHGPSIRFFKLELGEQIISDSVKDSYITVPLTREMKFSGGQVKVTIWVENKFPHEFNVKCDSVNICDLIDCFFCYDRFMNTECLTTLHWLTISLSILFSLWLINWIVKLFKVLATVCPVIMWAPKVLVKMLFRCCAGRVIKAKKYLKDSENLPLVDQSEDEIELRSVSAHSTPDKPKLSSRFYKVSLTLLSIFSIIKSADSCSITDSFTIPVKSCIVSGDGLEKCTLNHKTTLDISPVGQTSCFIVKDPMNLGLISLNIRTTSIDLVCMKKSLYWTFTPSLECPSIFKCPWTEGCNEVICDKMDPKKPYASLKSFAHKLSKQYCTRVAGCAGQGCFSCSQACLHYATVVTNPKRKSYQVSLCDQWTYQVKVEVSLMTQTETNVAPLTLVPGVFSKLYGMSFHLSSISTPQQPFLNKCLIESSGRIGFVSCNKESEITAGRIGEVQCPTEGDANQSSNKCKYQYSSIVVNHMSQSVSCSHTFLDVEAAMNDNLLPLKLKGVTLMKDGTTVRAVISDIGMFSLSINTNSKSLTIKTSKSKCFLTLESGHGCFSCSLGANLILKGNTDFETAKALVECPSGITFPVSLTNVVTTQNVTIRTDLRSLKETCTVSCPGGITTMNLDLDLKAFMPTLHINSSKHLGIQIQTESAVDWNSLLKNLSWANIMSYIWIFILLILGFILLPVIVNLVVMIVRNLKYHKHE